MDVNNFQRVGAVSNAHVGRDFESVAKEYLRQQGILLASNYSVPLGVASIVGVDAALDLAVLELQRAPTATPLTLDTSALSVGMQVYALGFPPAYNGPAPLMIVGYVAGFEARTVSAGVAPQQRMVAVTWRRERA